MVCQQLAQYTRKTTKTLKGQPALAEFGHEDDEQRLRCSVQSNAARARCHRDPLLFPYLELAQADAGELCDLRSPETQITRIHAMSPFQVFGNWPRSLRRSQLS